MMAGNCACLVEVSVEHVDDGSKSRENVGIDVDHV